MNNLEPPPPGIDILAENLHNSSEPQEHTTQTANINLGNMSEPDRKPATSKTVANAHENTSETVKVEAEIILEEHMPDTSKSNLKSTSKKPVVKINPFAITSRTVTVEPEENMQVRPGASEKINPIPAIKECTNKALKVNPVAMERRKPGIRPEPKATKGGIWSMDVSKIKITTPMRKRIHLLMKDGMQRQPAIKLVYNQKIIRENKEIELRQLRLQRDLLLQKLHQYGENINEKYFFSQEFCPIEPSTSSKQPPQILVSKSSRRRKRKQASLNQDSMEHNNQIPSEPSLLTQTSDAFSSDQFPTNPSVPEQPYLSNLPPFSNSASFPHPRFILNPMAEQPSYPQVFPETSLPNQFSANRTSLSNTTRFIPAFCDPGSDHHSFYHQPSFVPNHFPPSSSFSPFPPNSHEIFLSNNPPQQLGAPARFNNVSQFPVPQSSQVIPHVQKFIPPQFEQSQNVSTDNINPAEDTSVAVCHADYPSSMLSNEEVKLVQQSILKALHELPDNGPEVRFRGSKQEEGWLSIVCVDDTSAQWVSEISRALQPWRGARLKFFYHRDLPEPHVVKVYIPDDGKNRRLTSEEVFIRLHKMNRQLRTKKWRVLNREIFGSGQNWIFSIDQSSLEALTVMNFQAYFGFEEVKFHLQPRGKGPSHIKPSESELRDGKSYASGSPNVKTKPSKSNDFPQVRMNPSKSRDGKSLKEHREQPSMESRDMKRPKTPKPPKIGDEFKKFYSSEPSSISRNPVSFGFSKERQSSGKNITSGYRRK